MEFREGIDLLKRNIQKYKQDVHNEEATKFTFVIPFIQDILGYNVYNPKEVKPEFVADISKKKGEKVDFCILIDNRPSILIECKKLSDPLNLHHTQLKRYFHATESKFAILTNGIKYKFYTDLEKINIMDEVPFWELDFRKLNEKDIVLLANFRKREFDTQSLIDTAEDLKIKNSIKELLTKELIDPGPEFIKFILKAVREGRVTKKMVEAYTPIIKSSLKETLEDLVGERMVIIDQYKEKQQELSPSNGIVTTQEELGGLRIIRSMLIKYVEIERITYKDVKSYFNVLFDGHINKPICRLYLNSKTKYVSFRNSSNRWEKYKIEDISDLKHFSDTFIKLTRRYLIAENLSFHHNLVDKEETLKASKSHKGFTIYQ